LRDDLIEWLGGHKPNVFATVTLKQGRPHDGGGWTHISPEDMRETAWLLRDRVAKGLVGHKRRIPFLVFKEGDGWIKRYHLHITACLPEDINIARFSSVLREKAQRLDWVYGEIDVRPIEPNTENRVLKYCLKEGFDALLPEASYVPSED
jgi:hypothetical protein